MKIKTEMNETFTVHMTDNAAVRGRGMGPDSIFDSEFKGTMLNCLQRCAAMMNGCATEDFGYTDEEYLEWYGKMTAVEAQESMDSADLGAGSPVVFWIKDSKGNVIYDSGLDEKDWETQSEDLY